MAKGTKGGVSSAFTRLQAPVSLTDTLVARLKDEIVSGRLAPGARLPTEQQMMASFGVSRTVVREAVSALKSDGLVVTRQGSGAFVAPDPTRRPFRIDPNALRSIEDVLHVMELRLCVDIEAAGLAAERHNRGQGQAIEAALHRIDDLVAAGDATVEADLAFHRAIAVATNNPYHTQFLEFLGSLIIPRQTIRIGLENPDARRRYLARVQGEHREICRAILARNAAVARRAARRHLTNSLDRYRKFAKKVGSSVATGG